MITLYYLYDISSLVENNIHFCFMHPSHCFTDSRLYGNSRSRVKKKFSLFFSVPLRWFSAIKIKSDLVVDPVVFGTFSTTCVACAVVYLFQYVGKSSYKSNNPSSYVPFAHLKWNLRPSRLRWMMTLSFPFVSRILFLDTKFIFVSMLAYWNNPTVTCC